MEMSDTLLHIILSQISTLQDNVEELQQKHDELDTSLEEIVRRLGKLEREVDIWSVDS